MAGGSGVFGTLGKVMKPVGAVASMAGFPYVGIPLSVAGGAMEGGSKGGIKGGLLGGAKSGLGAAIGQGIGGAFGSGGGETLASPTDMGGYQGIAKSFSENPMWKDGGGLGETAGSKGMGAGGVLFSPEGSPLSTPEFGSKSPLFTSQGDPMTKLKGGS